MGVTTVLTFLLLGAATQDGIDPLPEKARLAFEEDWSSGRIDPARWYALRKKWGAGNHGVVPENVRIEKDVVDGKPRNVLVCEAHGDAYDGPVVGLWGRKERVGGVLVSKPFFASGRFEVAMKIGRAAPYADGPADPRKPSGCVPAIWTFAYRWVEVSRKPVDDFVPGAPLYNPFIKAYGIGANEYWSELDFPEFGKNGDFSRAMYNTFSPGRHDSRMFDVGFAADGEWHTYVTDWRTKLVPLPEVTDAHVVQHGGFWWVKDKAVPFESYLAHPLKRLGPNRYAAYAGDRATHWIDGRKVGENRRFVPAYAAQLNLGVWLPDWAGPARWKTADVRFASIRIWQYDDPGDVRGILTEDIGDNFDPQGRELGR
jgi:hypothetical protein